MMAPSHAMTGISAGVVMASAFHLSLLQTIVSMIVCAGAALLPDCDQPSSTFGHSFGIVTKYMSKLMYWTSSTIYIGTKTSEDTAKKSGHRKLTHTIVYNLILGSLLWLTFDIASVQYIVIALLITLGIRGLLAEGLNVYFPIDLNGRKKSKRILKTEQGSAIIVGCVVSFLLYSAHITFVSWHLALIIFAGCIIHLVGDCCTPAGVPLLWPAPISGKTWYNFSFPVTFDAGKQIEKNVITPVIALITIILTIYLLT